MAINPHLSLVKPLVPDRPQLFSWIRSFRIFQPSTLLKLSGPKLRVEPFSNISKETWRHILNLLIFEWPRMDQRFLVHFRSHTPIRWCLMDYMTPKSHHAFLLAQRCLPHVAFLQEETAIFNSMNYSKPSTAPFLPNVKPIGLPPLAGNKQVGGNVGRGYKSYPHYPAMPPSSQMSFPSSWAYWKVP